MHAHQLRDVTVVADAGMVSESNRTAVEAAGLSFILGMRIPDIPYVVAQWHREHPGEPIPDGHVFTQPWPAGPTGGRRDQVIYYQYRHDRGRRALRGIDEQVTQVEHAVAGKAAVRRDLSARRIARRPSDIARGGVNTGDERGELNPDAARRDIFEHRRRQRALLLHRTGRLGSLGEAASVHRSAPCFAHQSLRAFR
jgi:hypothetical protein